MISEEHSSFQTRTSVEVSALQCSTIPSVPETSQTRLDRVLAQLRLYEHPLLTFSRAREW